VNTPIVTINGINASAGHTVNRLGFALQNMGHLVTHLTYPTRRWWETRSRRSQYLDALGMVRDLEERHSGQPVDVIAHSWGCLLAARMMELGGTGIFRRVFLFAPALDADWIFPLHAFDSAWVAFNRGDRAVWAAEHLFGWWHPWGEMGRIGYRGEDRRVHNFEDLTPRTDLLDNLHDHYFRNGAIAFWCSFVSDRSSLNIPLSKEQPV
jgi:pimeloyl-ACP methyl ester carboxylesterase